MAGLPTIDPLRSVPGRRSHLQGSGERLSPGHSSLLQHDRALGCARRGRTAIARRRHQRPYYEMKKHPTTACWIPTNCCAFPIWSASSSRSTSCTDSLSRTSGCVCRTPTAFRWHLAAGLHDERWHSGDADRAAIARRAGAACDAGCHNVTGTPQRYHRLIPRNTATMAAACCPHRR